MAGTFRLCLAMIAVCLVGATCAPTDNPEPIPLVSELEPNDTLQTAQGLDLSADSVRLSGTLTSDEDVDLYALGDLQPGDRITVTVDTTLTDADLSLVLFEPDVDQGLATLFEAVTVGGGIPTDGPLFQGVIRKAGPYGLGVAQLFTSIETGANYDVTIQVQHGLEAPAAPAQIVMLEFGGGAFAAPDGNTVTIGPWTPTDNDPALAPSTTHILDTIVATTRANWGGYGVQILRSGVDVPPAGQPVSTVFFGPVLAGEQSLASDGLGVAAAGVDSFNTNPSDVAVVFADFFTPGLFSVSSLTPGQLGTALGNVASHEIGHLLGLQHAFDPTDVMNTFDAPATLLAEQRIKRSTVHFFVFELPEDILTQDAAGHLRDIVGSTRRRHDLELIAGTTPLAITSADFDLDGGLDLAVADFDSDSVSLFLNLGNRTLSEAITLNAGAAPLDIVAFDTDFNGLTDLITANPGDENLSALYLIPEGFTQPVLLTAGSRPRASAVGDFNGDFFPDLAVANFESDDVSILLNDGLGNFQVAATAAVGDAPISIAAADLDNDARLDLAVVNLNDDTVTVLQGAGDGSFTPMATLAAGQVPSSIAAADFNNDGRVDLAAVSRLSGLSLVLFGSSVSVLINQGMGNFSPQAIYSIEPGGEKIVAADLNRDGHIDLATANSADDGESGSVSLLFNRGDGTFGQDLVLQAGLSPSALVVLDLDGRGAPDLAVTNRESGTVSVFFNE